MTVTVTLQHGGSPSLKRTLNEAELMSRWHCENLMWILRCFMRSMRCYWSKYSVTMTVMLFQFSAKTWRLFFKASPRSRSRTRYIYFSNVSWRNMTVRQKPNFCVIIFQCLQFDAVWPKMVPHAWPSVGKASTVVRLERLERLSDYGVLSRLQFLLSEKHFY